MTGSEKGSIRLRAATGSDFADDVRRGANLPEVIPERNSKAGSYLNRSSSPTMRQKFRASPYTEGT
jgi:hypothetical protein